MGLLTVLKKLKQKEKEMRILMLYVFLLFYVSIFLGYDIIYVDYPLFKQDYATMLNNLLYISVSFFLYSNDCSFSYIF